ncbi:hypothetical protein WJX72_006908 [[Myrmecia] bisecta]|uniref:Uncharacterized protein n=1 Tax=[Myrmecia] bisecta TaxID=41462 RepID=A0AAW1R7K0_9CHLO
MSTWKTYWKPPEDLGLTKPEKDYRDRLPIRPEDVALQYQSVVRDGHWTFGLIEMWSGRFKIVKSAVHVPCCPSFRFNPCAWRGICFGRTLHQCYWFGCDRTRWARFAHALRLGREYEDPFTGMGRGHKDETCLLCWFNYALGCVLSLGIGQAISICGNYGVNFSACYSCHAREKFRRKYNLPPAFGLPPGFDDCCVHFLCMYCATHQELREAIVRGLDGPGMSVLDVNSEGWAHLPGYQEELDRRAAKLALLTAKGDLFLPFEQRMAREPGLIRREAANVYTQLARQEVVQVESASGKTAIIQPKSGKYVVGLPAEDMPSPEIAENFENQDQAVCMEEVDATKAVELQAPQGADMTRAEGAANGTGNGAAAANGSGTAANGTGDKPKKYERSYTVAY